MVTPLAVTALLLTPAEQRGSGVLLHRASGGLWLVTNRHVVEGLDQICVRTGDGRFWPGTVVLPSRSASLDLAFVWMAGQVDTLPLADTSASTVPDSSGSGRTWEYPIVRASGYPVPEERQGRAPIYRELKGLLLPLLPRPLEGGLLLASTSPVQKGMSGGGLFDQQGRLIGLNTTHADPLWSAPLRDESGQMLSAQLNRQLELVALAIPTSRVLPLLATLTPPAGPDRTRAPAAGSAAKGSSPAASSVPGRPAGQPLLTAAVATKPGVTPPVCPEGLW
ncbi:MAG: serine protease [Synechococcaceae cyanobacterium]|nr:serine protease [Synechococcaceae cyanobacterium]